MPPVKTELLQHIGTLTRIALEGVELLPMLDRIAHYLHEQFKLALVEITLNEADNQSTKILAQVGKSVLGLHIGDCFPLGKGLTSEVLRTEKSVYAPNVRLHPLFLRSAPHSKSNFLLPLMFRGQMLGVINLEADHIDHFKHAQRLLLEGLAAQLAGAVHLAQLNQRLAAQTAELARANCKLKRVNAELERSSLSDPLTTLANRRAWDQSFMREFTRAQRGQRLLSVAMIDADHFKAFNDRFGHAAGDRTLKKIASVLERYTRRSGELAARLGGEEFALLLPEVSPLEANRICERLLQEIAELRGCTTVSIGVYTSVPKAQKPAMRASSGAANKRLLPDQHSAIEKFLESADRALYQAKLNGRNRLVQTISKTVPKVPVKQPVKSRKKPGVQGL
jgi:diguanylate cyclase (GGDEF)-like protein